MVLMNLGVVALPIIELGRFFVDPVRTLLQRCDVLRGEFSTALVGDPALAPANADVDTSEVLRLPIWLNIGRTAAPTLAAEECPCSSVDLERLHAST
jgi:hypothetical protein